MLLKSSELIHASVWALTDSIYQSGLPRGAFNLVMGTGAHAGEPLSRHPEVDAASFTGSVPVGRRMARTARRGTRSRRQPHPRHHRLLGNHAGMSGELGRWHRLFREHDDSLVQVFRCQDILRAQRDHKLGILFGLQNCSAIEDDLSMVQILHELGVRIVQLSYNNQSLLTAGCYEQHDAGITRFGREVTREMNRVGMVIDRSQSAERSTLEAITLSSRPITIAHANPSRFHPALRNKSSEVLHELAQSGGMLGSSLYPVHLPNGHNCTLTEFCQMVADTVELMGSDHVGIGSDPCQNWGYETLAWMRSGRWSSGTDYGEGSAAESDWPALPPWFSSNRDFSELIAGLEAVGFDPSERRQILGGNWLSFFASSFEAN